MDHLLFLGGNVARKEEHLQMHIMHSCCCSVPTVKKDNAMKSYTVPSTMMGKCHVSMFAALLAFTLLGLPGASAWSNGGYSADPGNPDYGTHDWIADGALSIQTRDVTFLKVTYHSQFLLGTEAPDNPDYIGDTANHHVYFKTGDLLQDDASAVRASEVYNLAKGYLQAKDYLSAAYDIGVMAHYIADPGVFGHTMGSSTDWGTEVHHSDYETYANSLVGSITLPSGLTLEDMSAYDATLRLAEVVTFGEGSIQSNIWMDSNYDWSNSVFYSSAIASLYESAKMVAAVINHLMIEVAPPPPTAPDPPTSLTATVDNYDVQLTWNPPADDGGAGLTWYKIYRGDSLTSQILMKSVESDKLFWTDTTVQVEKTYYYWVAAVNSVGTSDKSQHTTATIPPAVAPHPPTQPAAVFSDTVVMLTWSAPDSDGGANITGYMIYRGSSPSSRILMANLEANSLTWSDTSTERGETYHYWVTAVNSVGEGDLSLEVTVTIPEKKSSLVTPVLISAITLALASAGVLVLRRRRGKA